MDDSVPTSTRASASCTGPVGREALIISIRRLSFGGSHGQIARKERVAIEEEKIARKRQKEASRVERMVVVVEKCQDTSLSCWDRSYSRSAGTRSCKRKGVKIDCLCREDRDRGAYIYGVSDVASHRQ